MKILFLAPGNSIHTIKWVNALQNRGNEICLVSLLEHRVAEPLESGIIVKYLAFNGKKGYYINALALRKVAKEFNPDVINAHYASGYGTLMRVSRVPRNKCILSVWGDDVYRFPYENRITSHIIQRNLLYVFYIASTSFCMKEQVKTLLNANRNITVTPFGVDTEAFSAKASAQVSRKFVFGCMKSVEYQYGIDILIKAFAEFIHSLDKEEQDNVCLKIYGEGSAMEEMYRLAETIKVRKQVEFCGRISNKLVPNALNEIDVLCLTSVETESFGVAALEAMACQVPVIVSDVVGYKEVVVDGKTGLIVPQFDVKATCMAMERLYKEPRLRERLGEHGREWVLEKYKWEDCVQKMIDLYHKVCPDKD